MFIELQFKGAVGSDAELRLKQEFRTQVTGMLRAVLLDAACFAWIRWHVKLLVTCLIRTEAENKATNGNPKSAHFRGDAGDLRSHNLTAPQIEELEEYLRHTWGPIVHFRYHDAGTGPHIHINVNYPYHRKVYV
jgi:hypothetical protein